jgi:two-component system, cell cycle sensor histidine kinase DivJ
VAKFLSLLKSVGDTFAAMCQRWVNERVTDTDERQSHARLFGFLFAIPPFATLFLIANIAHITSLTVALPLLVLAFAVPVLAASWLSLKGTSFARSSIILMAPSCTFLLLTQNAFAPNATMLLLFAVIFFELVAKRVGIKLGGSAAEMLCVVSFLASKVSAAEAPQTFYSLLPVALLAMLYAASSRAKVEVATVETVDNFDSLASLVAPHNAFLIAVERTGSVVKLSSNVEALLSLTAEELAGRGLVSRVHVADLVSFMSALDAVRTGMPQVEAKVRLKRGGNADKKLPQWLMLNISAIPDGELIHILGRVEERAELAKDTSGTHDLSSNSLAVVSHELRTPLNAIVGFTDLLRQEMFGALANERQREYIELVHQSGHHLLDLVNALLDMSKLESGTYELTPETFMPSEAASFAIAMVSAQAQAKKIGLDFMPMTAFEEFNGDRRISQQILINLLSNAVKFTPENGHIRLSVDLDDDRLMLIVEDNGIGMAADKLSKIGTPFYQAHSGHARSFEGAGLGLALVKQLVRLHGGAFEISSEEGQGTKIKVALPPLALPKSNISPLHPVASDESVRLIRIAEERDYETQRQTA